MKRNFEAFQNPVSLFHSSCPLQDAKTLESCLIGVKVYSGAVYLWTEGWRLCWLGFLPLSPCSSAPHHGGTPLYLFDLDPGARGEHSCPWGCLPKGIPEGGGLASLQVVCCLLPFVLTCWWFQTWLAFPKQAVLPVSK